MSGETRAAACDLNERPPPVLPSYPGRILPYLDPEGPTATAAPTSGPAHTRNDTSPPLPFPSGLMLRTGQTALPPHPAWPGSGPPLP